MFQNPSTDEIRQFLQSIKRIAVVGLSPKAERPSYRVAAALQRFGYDIVPVRPAISEVLGQAAYPGLSVIPGQIDLVDVFRNPDEVDAIVDECIRLNLPAIWLQDGVVNEAAALRAKAAGMFVVMDRCTFRDYTALCL
jgi:predicted CoA-binding protein